MSESVKAESGNGSIEFVGNGVIVKTKGGSKTIPLSSIAGVEFKKAGMLAGYIRLSVPGSAEVKGAGSIATNKNYQIQQDPNAIQFSRSKLNPEFEAVAEAINRALLGS